MYKYNCSDPNWIGDDNCNSFNLMLGNVKLIKENVGPSIPKEIDIEILNKIDLNIRSCTPRIMLQAGNKGENDIISLEEEAYNLRNPKTTEFNWDLSIYERFDENNENDENDDDGEDGENDDDDDDDEEEDNDFAIGDEIEKVPIKRTVFNVGKKRTITEIEYIDYRIGDMVILLQGNKIFNIYYFKIN